jgi:hypothetical protein
MVGQRESLTGSPAEPRNLKAILKPPQPGTEAPSCVAGRQCPFPVDKHMALFIAIVKAAPKPVYVHCRAGVDRTGVLSAAYRVLIDGASRREAVAEMGRYHSPWQSLDARYIYDLSDARREKILREAADWESRIAIRSR